MSIDSFKTKSQFKVNGKTYQYFDLKRLPDYHKIERLPYALKILLENLVRLEDSISVHQQDISKLINWSASAPPEQEIAFTPSRVILQDFTGVPAIVDLAAMREAMQTLKGDPLKINPITPVELVIDHSVMVDYSGSNQAFAKNTEKEFERNQERYAFLRWGQTAFKNFKVVPPGTGIVHQVNLEYLARVVFEQKKNGEILCYPDTLVGTDSHTTMINGLGILGWGVGGIEAEAAMLGQPITMLIPDTLGFKLQGRLSEGTTATDLVLTVVEMLRKKNVVGKFVEFYGEGLDNLPIADRATIANMAPEYGATCGIFPIDQETLHYLELTGRSKDKIALIEQYAKLQGLFRDQNSIDAEYTDTLVLDLSTVEPCIAGPKRPQDRISLRVSKEKFQPLKENSSNPEASYLLEMKGKKQELNHGSVVIAAITSCTNTSNPDVMLAAGLLAKNARELGLETKPWVKTSLAPGSQVVTDYYEKSGLIEPLNQLGFQLVGYGCTTCIGNSGPLFPEVSEGIKASNLNVAAVLSGNRNFEGRIHPEVRFAYLASPPLCVAYALAGTMNIDFYNDPIGHSANGKPVMLKDIWPSRQQIQETLQTAVQAKLFSQRYRSVYDGDARWQNQAIPKGALFEWSETSTYIKKPPFFEDLQATHTPPRDIQHARVLALLGDSVTTDHISPAGDIAVNSPAGKYLQNLGVQPQDFNSYGARRGNHEVMMRGTFANIRLKNFLIPDKEGPFTVHFPSEETLPIYDAAMRYQTEATPLIILAGKEYGTGSSRDWAAKGTRLLGIRAVIAESFERIHRSNLIGMGVLPLQFKPGENATSLGLTGFETFEIKLQNLKPRQMLKVNVASSQNPSSPSDFEVRLCIDTPKELDYYQQGGILQTVLRELANRV